MKNYLNDVTLLSDNTEHPEIYVACLDSYNDGNIHGAWINATKPVKDILGQIAIMQYEGYHGTTEMSFEGYCPDPDTYAIHCHRGFYNLKIYVNSDIEEVRAYAFFIAEYGELGAELISLENGNLEKAKTLMNECYVGKYESQSAYATELFNQNYLPKIPEELRFCINYKQVKDAIFMRQGFSIKVGGKAHVFRYLKKAEFNTKDA